MEPHDEQTRQAIEDRVREEFFRETGFRIEGDARITSKRRRRRRLHLAAYAWLLFAGLPAFFGVTMLLYGFSEAEVFGVVVGASLALIAVYAYVRGFRAIRERDRPGQLLDELHRRIALALGEKPKRYRPEAPFPFRRAQDDDL